MKKEKQQSEWDMPIIDYDDKKLKIFGFFNRKKLKVEKIKVMGEIFIPESLLQQARVEGLNEGLATANRGKAYNVVVKNVKQQVLAEKIKEIKKTTTRGLVYDGVRSKEIIEILNSKR